MKVGPFASTIGLILSTMLFVFMLYKLLQMDDNELTNSSVKQPLLIQINSQKHIVPLNQTHSGSCTYALEKTDLDYYKAIREEKTRNSKSMLSLELEQKHEQDQAQDHVQVPLLDEIMQVIRTDSQNVHDTTVQDTTSALFKSIVKDDALIIDDDDAIDKTPVDILYFAAKSDMTKNNVEQVRFVLDQIRKRDAAVYNLDGQTETQVLHQVWDSGNENVRRQLLNELVECKMPSCDSIYCPTGVVTRIMNAVAIENPDKMARTSDTLRMEMMNTAVQVRDSLNNDTVYKALSEDEQLSQFKQKLETTCIEKYNGVVSTAIVKKELDSWIDYV